MKKYFIIALSVVALAFTSCADFLNTSPQGSPTTTTFFQNDDQAEQFIKTFYYEYSDEWCYGRNIMWEQIGANDFVLGRTYADRFSGALLTITGDEGSINDIYGRCYQWIADAQWGIQQLEAKKAASGLTEIETRSLGECYFFRALFHWAIASRHGLGTLGVPYKPWEEYENGYNNEILPQQPSVVDNYLYIISDLKKAEELLPWNGSITATYGAEDRGRAHKVSAIGYQAKVWAYAATWKSVCDQKGLQPWNEVEKIVNRLESEFGRGLNDSFSDLWSSDFAKFWNKECVFSITGDGGPDGRGGVEFPGVILENQGWGIFNGWGQFKASYDIYAEMAKDNWQGEDENGKPIKNERLAKSIWEYGDYMMFFGEPRLYWSATDAESGLAVAKYYDAFKHKDPIANGYVNSSGDWPTTRCNFHMLRFADLMLLRAEACFHLYGSDKYNDIAKIHKRSTGADFKGNATWADLYHERRCELAFEMTGHLEDIKRWTVMKNNGQSIGELGTLAYTELMKHPDVFHAQLSPMYGLLTDKDGNYFDNDGDGKMDEGPLYVKVSWKDGEPVLSEEYEYLVAAADGSEEKRKVKFDGVDELGNGLVNGQPVVYYGQRNNPGAVMVVGPYQDYNTPRPTWNDNMLAIPYPTNEIVKAGGLYQQVPR